VARAVSGLRLNGDPKPWINDVVVGVGGMLAGSLSQAGQVRSVKLCGCQLAIQSASSVETVMQSCSHVLLERMLPDRPSI
jgi:hypothetical protein